MNENGACFFCRSLYGMYIFITGAIFVFLVVFTLCCYILRRRIYKYCTSRNKNKKQKKKKFKTSDEEIQIETVSSTTFENLSYMSASDEIVFSHPSQSRTTELYNEPWPEI